MRNQYISRYSHYDTHFKRNDPWPHIPFEDDNGRLTTAGKYLFSFVVLLLMILSGAF